MKIKCVQLYKSPTMVPGTQCLINVSYYSTTHPSSEPHTSKFQVQPLTFLSHGTGSPSPGYPSRHRSLYTSANSSPLRKTVHHFLKIPGDTAHSYPSQHHHPGFSHLHYLPPPSLLTSTLSPLLYSDLPSKKLYSSYGTQKSNLRISTWPCISPAHEAAVAPQCPLVV